MGLASPLAILMHLRMRALAEREVVENHISSWGSGEKAAL
jgi:hypothetical protein